MIMARKLYVKKLSQITTDQKLFDHFSQLGKVISAIVVKSINLSINSGHGYVIMATEEEAKKAILKLNGTLLDGNHIWVIQAHPIDQEKKEYYYRRRY